MKIVLALGAAAAAAASLTAVPADARMHSNHIVCMQSRNGHCVAERRAGRNAMYRVGYRFAPNYGYTAYSELPRTYVTRYRLRPNSRYVYRDNYIYQVDPRTYAVERVINALTR